MILIAGMMIIKIVIGVNNAGIPFPARAAGKR